MGGLTSRTGGGRPPPRHPATPPPPPPHHPALLTTCSLIIGISGEEDPALLTELGLTRDALRGWGVEISPDDIAAAKNCTSVEDDIITPARDAGARRSAADNVLSAAQWVAQPPRRRRTYDIWIKREARLTFSDFQTQGERAEFSNLARILRAPMYT